MKLKRTGIAALTITGALAMGALLLLITSVWAGPNAGSQAVSLAAADIVSGTLSYQGRLLDSSGDPVDGTCVMTFKLYGQATGGTPLWTQSGSVEADEGLFNVNLDVDTTLFDGRELWLGVQLTGEAEMTPRQPLLPAPYSLSLRPGAVISGTLAGNTAAVLHGINNGDGPGVKGTGASAAGVVGVSQATDRAGVIGLNEGQGDGPGVYGQSQDGPGVKGTSDNAAGVVGVSQVISRAGVIGLNQGDGPGVYGQSDGGPGVKGQSTDGAGGYFASTNRVGVYVEDSGLAGVYIASAGVDGVRVQAAGQDGLRIFDTVGRDYIRAGSDADPHFLVLGTGEVRSDVGFNTPASDLAEMMVVEGDPAGYEPGDVLVISSTRDQAVGLSSTPYARAVIGVYSSAPGFVGGRPISDGEQVNSVPVAILGIVPCKVSAENGPIRHGDLLVTSSTPGHAMRAEDPPPGTILGKALGMLDAARGTGVILVLVTLQ